MATCFSIRACAGALSLATATTLGGCVRKAVVVHPVILDRGYPTKSQLADVARAPLPPREEAFKRGFTVDEWELAGPFPERPGSTPFAGDNGLAQSVAERLAASKSGVVLTESMVCYAREIGRFVARHEQLPDDDLQAFAAGRCGVVPVAPSFVYSLPDGAVTDETAIRFFEEATWKAAPSSELGIWAGEDGSRHVLLAAFGLPKIKLAAVDAVLGDARAVRVRGTVLEPTAWLRAYTTDGSLGFHACRPTRRSALTPPDFDLTCQVSSGDPYAVLDMLAAPPEAVLGREVLMLVLPTARPVPSTFHRLAIYGVPSQGTLLEQFNAVRAKLGRAGLREVPLQSRTAHALVPHYFAAASNQDWGRVDFITLGMMAGWDIAGPLRDSQFLSFRGLLGEGAPSLLSQLLFFPSNRAVLLDPEAKEAALATMVDEKDKSVWGLMTTYTMFEPRTYPDVEKELLDELDRQRQARGKPPVNRIATTEIRGVLDHVAEKLAVGKVTPLEGLQEAMRTLSRRFHHGFNGRAAYAMTIDGWRPTFDGALLDNEDVAVVTKVGFFAPPGHHWGEYIGYFVFGQTFDPNMRSNVPKRERVQ